MSRRDVGTFALGGAALALTGCGREPNRALQPRSRNFPDTFKWGVSTSAFQTEGALTLDGRGESIWDRFSHGGAHIRDRSTAAVATDSYHRFGEDIALARGANAKAYRFSIAWPRVQPLGMGLANPKGLDFYDRMVDAQLAAGLEPFATLFHWDLPQALQDRGGWRDRDTAAHFANYATLIVDRLGDRVKNFVTLNEAVVHTVLGHVLGTHAPGLKSGSNIGPVTHHQNLAHGLAVQAMRSQRADLSIGASLALSPARPSGGPLAFWNRIVSTRFGEMWNRGCLDPLLKGTYPASLASFMDPVLRTGDMETIHQRLDFIGINYYAPAYVSLDLRSESHVERGDPPVAAELDAFGREIDPSGLAELLGWLRRDYGNPTIIVTENGCSDRLGAGGRAVQDDHFRIRYLARHLEAVRVAMEEGSNVAGFFVWSLIDNWEWDFGFTAKFGLVSQAWPGGPRRPKASYRWVADLARTNRLAPLKT